MHSGLPLSRPSHSDPSTDHVQGPPTDYPSEESVLPEVTDGGQTIYGSDGSGGAAASLRSRFPFLGAPKKPDELGCLGPYRIRGILGEGGMGVVFDAEDTQLHRRVALKILKPGHDHDPVLRERFLQEARAAAALPQDHVVTVYQVGTEGRVPFIAMQYLHGESLDQYQRRLGKLPAAEVVRIGREIALGLAVAHEHGLIHRDIKPANIWMETGQEGAPPRVKLLDFGLAYMSDSSVHLTKTGLFVGTPQYLSPEQARCLPVDPRSDLFSLGCVLYRLLTGTLPFQGEDLFSLLTALAVKDPRPIHDYAPEAPSALVELVNQLLEKVPAERPASARVVAERLRQLTPSEGSTAERDRPEVAARRPRSASRVVSLVSRLAPRKPHVCFGVLVSVLVVLMATGLVLRNMDRPQAAPIDCSLQGHPVVVGVLQSHSGPLGSAGSPLTEATLLAIEEINQQGGVLGGRVQPIIVDGTSEPAAFPARANKLILENHVCALFGCCTPGSRRSIVPVVEKYKSLLFYPALCEGLEQSPNVVYLGLAPNQQVIPAVQYATGVLRKRRLFLVGSEQLFAHTANTVLRDALIDNTEARIVGEVYLPVGTSDVRDVIAEIRRVEPDLIVNTIHGDTNTAFFRSLRVAGVTAERVPTLSFCLGENELRALPPEQVAGDYLAGSYFASVARPENTAFVRRFRARYGPQRGVTDAMEAAYASVHLWARAVRKAGCAEPAAVRKALADLEIDAPGGPVRIDADNHHAWKVVRIARLGAGGECAIVWSTEIPVRPEPFPAPRERREWQHFLEELHQRWNGRWEQ